MPVIIEGITYFSLDEVAREVDVTRQTLWRWRQAGSIPSGHRFRRRRVIFTAEEREAVREFANRVEPADAGARQLRLFNGAQAREG
jgi:hypothetical protein